MIIFQWVCEKSIEWLRISDMINKMSSVIRLYYSLKKKKRITQEVEVVLVIPDRAIDSQGYLKT